MTIGLLTIEFHLPESRSLKAKRGVLRRMMARLKNHHNVAVAEIDYQDKWQRGTVGIVTLASNRDVVMKTLEAVEAEAELQLRPGLVISARTETVEPA